MSMVHNSLSVRERTSYWARIISNRNRQIGEWRSAVALPSGVRREKTDVRCALLCCRATENKEF
jgi:hypothetical protein